MHVIALTGGIASGKSTVAARWSEHGAVVVDADVLAREVVAPGAPALAQIVERFGIEVLQADGSLNRQELGRIIFGDHDAREALNAITHPAIAQLAQLRFDSACEQNSEAMIVYDVPLLHESGRSRESFCAVVTVEAAVQTRIQRLVDYRGMEQAEAQKRVEAQSTSEQRMAIADFVIDSGATVADTISQADEVWKALKQRLFSAG